LAPERIAEVSARFIARRKATRFCSCSAIDCATSCASSSGRLISRMFTFTGFFVIRCRSRRRASTSAPDLPITIPGRAVWMSTVISPRCLTMLMSESPAWESLFSMWSRIAMSSSRRSAKLRSSNQFDFQSWMYPTRKPSGWIFCPISLCGS
jgi:hypothetical protein